MKVNVAWSNSNFVKIQLLYVNLFWRTDRIVNFVAKLFCTKKIYSINEMNFETLLCMRYSENKDQNFPGIFSTCVNSPNVDSKWAWTKINILSLFINELSITRQLTAFNYKHFSEILPPVIYLHACGFGCNGKQLWETQHLKWSVGLSVNVANWITNFRSRHFLIIEKQF